MSTESDWVDSLIPRLQKALQGSSTGTLRIEASSGKRLAYRYEVFRYKDTKPVKANPTGYETDILVRDQLDDGLWVPRVVVECKLGRVTTHDAITYSAKVDTHKEVHPYLRYGMLIGNIRNGVPRRLFRHGASFDFMAAWRAEKPSYSEWKRFIEVLRLEIEASRLIEELVTRRQSSDRKYSLVHRRLELTIL